jgi:hypothetical protein
MLMVTKQAKVTCGPISQKVPLGCGELGASMNDDPFLFAFLTIDICLATYFCLLWNVTTVE